MVLSKIYASYRFYKLEIKYYLKNDKFNGFGALLL
jgi:hypothetical protein